MTTGPSTSEPTTTGTMEGRTSRSIGGSIGGPTGGRARAGLGRGLESLIPTEQKTGFAVIPVGEISSNPNQPRGHFDEEALESLAGSIRQVGVLQPVTVTVDEAGGYVLVAGERRLRAAKRAGLTEIPAVIRTVDNDGSLVEAIIENVQREDLTALEEAAAYRQLLEDFGLTHESVGERVGKSRSAVSNSLRLLALPPGVQGLLERGALSAGHARALAAVEDKKFAEHIAARAAEEGWSVRQVEDAVRLRQGDPTSHNTSRVKEIRPVEIIELEQRLTDKLGTKVRISYGNRRGARRGRVEIDFASLDDLERLYRRFFS